MKGKYTKDKRLRRLYSKSELNYLVHKALLRDERLSQGIRLRAKLYLLKQRRNKSKVRISNRCSITGRSGSVIREFRLSRIAFKKYASSGYLPGVRKASW